MIAVDPAKFQSTEITDRIVEELEQDIKSSEPADEGCPVRYPGERIVKTRRENMENGIPVIQEKWEEIQRL